MFLSQQSLSCVLSLQQVMNTQAFTDAGGQLQTLAAGARKATIRLNADVYNKNTLTCPLAVQKELLCLFAVLEYIGAALQQLA